MLDLKAVGDALIAGVKGYFGPKIEALEQKYSALDQRIASVPAGKSAYELAVGAGFVGTEAEWIASLKGASVKGDPGKDADPADVARIVGEAVAALPPPAEGKSVTVDDVAPLIAEQVAAAVAALPVPVAGKDAAPALIQAAVAEAVAALPVAKNGTSVTVEDVLPMIAEQVASAVAAVPPAPAGKDADPAVIEQAVASAVAALPPAKDGKSLAPADVAPMLADLVKSAVAALPVPKDGAPGTSVSLTDVTAFLESVGAKWALDFERRAADVLQRAVDRMPAAKDGRDAFDLDDIDMTQSEDGRTITLAFRRGTDVREKTLTLAVFSDRGVYRTEGEYLKGDGVTFGGSYFIAQKDAPGKPEDGTGGWRLAVKRGRDGRDLTDPAHKPPPPVKL